MARLSKSCNPLAAEIHGSTQSAAHNSDIVWSGDAWLCQKQLMHYPAFSRNLTNISVYSFVRILDDDKKVFLGYVEDLFEDMMGEKMVRLRPFLFGEDIEALIPELNPQTREVFITSTELEISAKHIDGPAEVLTPTHFNRDLFLTLKCFVCHREFKNSSVNPFSLSKLRGYSSQPIISSLENRAPKPSRGRRKATAEARPIILALESVPVSRGKQTEKGSVPVSRGKQTEKGSVPMSRGKQTEKGSVPVSRGKQTEKDETTRERLKGKLANKGKVESIVPGSKVLSDDNQNDNVEVLSQDSGMRGCWFRCKILHSSQKLLKVQHYDVTQVDGPGKLEEWVPKSRVANPDKLGIRCRGRLTVRPWPQWDSSDLKFETGVAVDAWWSDGWWEGVVTGYDMSSNDNLQVYLPGENKFLIVGKKDIRVSKDWVNDQWMDVKAKSDIFSFLNSYLNSLPKVKLPSVLASSKVCDPTTIGGIEDGKMKLPISLLTSEANKKSVEDLHLEQLMKIKEKEDWTRQSTGNAAKKGKSGKTAQETR